MRSRTRAVLLAFAVATLLGLLEILRTSLVRALGGEPHSPVVFVQRLIPLWVMLIVVSPWCAFMARRFPIRPARAGATLAAHAAGGVVFVALHMTLMGLYHQWMMPGSPWPLGWQLLHLFGFYAGLELSVYAAIVLVLLLFESRREAAERAVTEARLAERLADARLTSLQAQIQPHFLFNTLNTLAVLARRGDGPTADRAIGDLGELLRTSFDTRGRPEIPLGVELEFLERYVRLQGLRFPGRLAVEWDVAAEARRAVLPPLAIQPLVENAIEHGLATDRGGRVRVAARREGATLVVEVDDDGPGFETPAGTSGNGVGIANTRERLRLLHGDAGSLETCASPRGGGRVILRLPWRDTGEAEGR